ncbi:MAG: sarcosine oxidase subunit gamma family protein [Pseudomonadota bacterium]
MAEALRNEPLEDRVFGDNGVILQPVEACERISLRADSKSTAALGKAIGVELPGKPGTSHQKNGIAALWIGPDEWFVTAPYGTGLEAAINGSKAGLFSAVSIDHRNTALTISGKNAVNTLNSGCARDLSLDAFPVGCCSRTQLAKAEIILWRTGEHEFRVECWRSFSDYVWKYLVTAARSA